MKNTSYQNVATQSLRADALHQSSIEQRLHHLGLPWLSAVTLKNHRANQQIFGYKRSRA
ncbi:MAG: hypothetical protein WCH99_12645 [Verrucomicrobiota bacterium]